MLHVGPWRGVGGAGDGGVGDAAGEGVEPDGEYLVADGVGVGGLVAGEPADGALVEDVGEDVGDGGMVFVDVGGEEVAEVRNRAVGGAEGEWAFVDGAAVEVEVFDVDFFVVDEKGEGEVDGGGLAQAPEGVVFPFERGRKGVFFAFFGQYFLEEGDVVECRRVDDEPQYAVVGGGGERYAEVVGGLAGGGENHRRVELAVEKCVVLRREGDLAGVEGVVAFGVAAGGKEEERQDEGQDGFDRFHLVLRCEV